MLEEKLKKVESIRKKATKESLDSWTRNNINRVADAIGIIKIANREGAKAWKDIGREKFLEIEGEIRPSMIILCEIMAAALEVLSEIEKVDNENGI